MTIFDINLQYTLSDVLISITLFVFSFMAFLYVGYFRDLKGNEKDNDKFKDMLIEGYFHKFDEYNKIISDLRTKLDMIEIKVNSAHDKSRQIEFNAINAINTKSNKSREMSHHLESVTDNVIITNDKNDENDQISTVDHILKMLEVPLTSREIQRRIKKSREHTSRLLKKLYSQNIVMRDESSRPFKYEITNEGRKLLEQTSSSNH